MQKIYYIDTNVLIDNPNAVELLSDNQQNRVKIHYGVINEIDKLKKDPKLNHIASQIIKNLLKNNELYDLVGKYDQKSYVDEVLLNYIKKTHKNNSNVILVTSDKILQIKALKKNIKTEGLKRSNPFIDTTNGDYSGLIDFEKNKAINNCFFWKDDILFYYKNENDIRKVKDLTVWNVEAKDIYQNMVFTLGLDNDIDIFTVQGPAGTGKTFLSLALAFYHVFEKKNYEKIYITKAVYEIGQKMGYLPGNIDEKMAPYMEYIQSLIEKLTCGNRKISKLYKDIDKLVFNPKKFQVLPINYIRGRDIENAFIIIDETQNLSRDETRTLLTRMGNNVKCICIGDKSQIDNPYLNYHNNGINWILKSFKDSKNYGHVTMNSKFYRGPICELAIKTGL